MDALILAAGYGSRLGNLTKNKQKCLLPVKGRPLLDYWIEYCIALNINKIFINSHHCSEDLHRFIQNHKFKDNIIILNEKELLGTGGTLIANIPSFSNDLFFIHGDNYIAFDTLKNFYNHYKTVKNNTLFWMMLHQTNQPENCGVVKLKDNIVMEFYEKVKNPPSNIANSAIYILKKKFISILRDKKINFPVSFSDNIIPDYLGKIYGFTSNQQVIDIGLIDNYNKVK